LSWGGAPFRLRTGSGDEAISMRYVPHRNCFATLAITYNSILSG
jgi:hypothetical protein